MSPSPDSLPIAIIGAGVAGLVLAQGLRQHGIPFRLFERHSRHHQRQGHRFRVSADAWAALENALVPDLRELLGRTAPARPDLAPRYPDASTMRFEAAQPADVVAMPIDRAWVRAVLELGIEDRISYGAEFSRYDVVPESDEGGGHVAVRFADGKRVRASLVVGADGLRSAVRRQFQPARRLLDLHRWILWGRTPLTSALREQLPPDFMSWFMAIDKGAEVQVVVEPVVWDRCISKASGGRLGDFDDYLYWAMATAPRETLPTTAEQRRHLVDAVAGKWDPMLKRILDEADHELSSCIPVLSSKPDIELPSTSNQQPWRVTVIGDAAHTMSPMGSAGGDLAIRDAADLANVIAAGGLTKGVLRRFEEAMAERAKEKLTRAFSNSENFWAAREYQETRL